MLYSIFFKLTNLPTCIINKRPIEVCMGKMTKRFMKKENLVQAAVPRPAEVNWLLTDNHAVSALLTG